MSNLTVSAQQRIFSISSKLPTSSEIVDDEKRGFESNLASLQPSDIHVSLRAYVDDLTCKVPQLLVEPSVDLLKVLLEPVGVVFNDSKRRDWNINREPEGGIVVVGIPLWSDKQLFCYAVGSESFIQGENFENKVLSQHEAQLTALEHVLDHAPPGRDVGSCVERVLRMCVAACLVHVARILPTDISRNLLFRCQEKTLNFVSAKLFAWKNSSFWNATHEKLVRWNVELRIKDGGTGLIPQYLLVHASYAASWFQPLCTMAQARNISEIAFLNKLNEFKGFPSIQNLKTSLGKIGYDDDLLTAYNAFQETLHKEVQRRLNLLDDGRDPEFAIGEIIAQVKATFKWQQFFSRGILESYAKKYVQAVSNSTLFFAKDDLSRIEDRQDKFARRIFVTQLWDPRARVPLHEFRLFRAYIFGVFIRPGKDRESGGLASYPCLIMNKKGLTCGLRCDPFGHGAFLCKCTSRTSDHNHARDILTSMTQAFEFISTKEVVIAPWEKKPDVEIIDPKGEFLNIYM